MIYVVYPDLTGAPVGSADLLTFALPTLELVTVAVLRTRDSALDAAPGVGDGVVVFNPIDGRDIAPEVADLLDRASSAGAVVLPVAMESGARRPPDAVADQQSFDVVDHLRRRDLNREALATIGPVLGREVLSRLLPTLSHGRVRVFVCHRRTDGEDYAAELDKALSARHQYVFRDLVEIQVGEVAQERIDEALQLADVVVFLDTPDAGESEWVAHELATSLARNVPVVWVRIGLSSGRAPLSVLPSGRPHITVEGDRLEPERLSPLADEVLEAAFELARSHVRIARSTFERIRRQATALNHEVSVLDASQLLYQITESVSGPYPVRSRVHVVQVYGRHPMPEDVDSLDRWLAENGYGPHDVECRAFDAAVLLDPMATDSRQVGDWAVVDSPAHYLELMASVAEPEAVPDRTLLILGSFPTSVGAHRVTLDAVHAVTTAWLSRGGKIVFGGHPTFTPLVVGIAQRLGVSDRVRLYQSTYFVSEGALAAFEALTSVVAVDGVSGDRAESLTRMRQAMITPGIDAAVVIGGRTTEGGTHHPGVDEEIRLARDAGIRVFALGASGGRAAEIASVVMSPESCGLPEDEANAFVSSDDFESLTEAIWRAIRSAG